MDKCISPKKLLEAELKENGIEIRENNDKNVELRKDERRNGFHLKPLESILTHLFVENITPRYSSLVDVKEYDLKILVKELPERKRLQIKSMMQYISCLCSSTNKKIEIVDFGGGSGSLSIPLVFAEKNVRVVVVDLKVESLALLHDRIEKICNTENSNKRNLKHGVLEPTAHQNLFTFVGSIQDYPHPFDIALGLHICGSGSDIILHKCLGQNACFVISPCCHGKLQHGSLDPYIYQATHSNMKCIKYPQSKTYQKQMTRIDFDILSKGADREGDLGQVSKAFLEWDRVLFMQQNNYIVFLSKMQSGSGLKDNLLIGWPRSSRLKMTQEIHLVEHGKMNSILNDFKNKNGFINYFWTLNETTCVSKQCIDFIDSSEETLFFPTGQGSKQRKLIHFMAEHFNLRHWSEGSGKNRRVIISKIKNLKSM